MRKSPGPALQHDLLLFAVISVSMLAAISTWLQRYHYRSDDVLVPRDELG